jgi:hypothetical protein
MARGWRVRGILGIIAAVVMAGPLTQSAWGDPADSPALDEAQRMFYNGRYAEATLLTQDLCTAEAETLAACELRTSALLFQLRRALGGSLDKEEAFTLCASCPALLSTFVSETRRVQTIARARLELDPDDEETLFFLGKLDLNYVWLQLGTLGRKTGWDEYWEARRSLDKVLKQNPHHVRAKVARAWIDYIVDTKMPRGTRWLLGGGNKKRGLRAVREAASIEADLFVRAEAGFALWDMQVRERNIAEARATAAALAEHFPDNPELRKFLEAPVQAASQ